MNCDIFILLDFNQNCKLAGPQDQRQSKTNGDFLKTHFMYLDTLIRASAKLLNINIALPALELNLMLLDSNCNHCTRVGTVRCCKQHSNISNLKHQIFGFIIKITNYQKSFRTCIRLLDAGSNIDN